MAEARLVPDPPDASAITLTDLLDRVGGGDAEALDQLLGRRLPELNHWVAGQLPRWALDLADTTTLVQETLLTSFARHGRFACPRPGAFGHYLRAALLNRLRDEVRRVRRASANTIE